VLDGEITIKLGDDVTKLRPRDPVRIAASTAWAVRNDGDTEAAFAMCSVRVEDFVAESVGHDGFWPAS
jgi:glyoxylate utilization-related uncharacterized protein